MSAAARRLSADDRLDITELLARYARALDRGDVEAFAATFAPDGVLHLATGANYVGHERLKQFAEAFRSDPAFPGGQHFVSQILIEGTPQRCAVSAYVMRTLRMANGTTSIHFLGQYDDVCVKRANRWEFASRTVRRWPLQSPPAGEAAPQSGSADPSAESSSASG